MKPSLRSRVLSILERYYQEWRKDDDWWHGLWDCDINVYYEGKNIYSIDVYGLTPTSNGLYETNTGDLKGSFRIEL